MIRLPAQQFVLRQYQPSDLAAMVQYFSHSAVRRLAIGQSQRYTQAEGTKYLRKKIRQYKQKKIPERRGQSESLGYAIDIDGKLVGGVEVTVDGLAADIGYWLAKPWWRRGIMTWVVRAWSNYIFQTFQVEKIEARVFPFNQASIRVLQKNSFYFKVHLVYSQQVGKKYLDELVFVKNRRT